MQNPTVFQYAALIITCLLFTLAGLYLLANFGKVLKSTIRNELVRKNVVAWLIIFCLNCAILPMSGGFFYIVNNHGWGHAIAGQLISATLCTLVIFNLARVVVGSHYLKKQSFVVQNLLLFLTVTITTLLINVPMTYWMYAEKTAQYIQYVVVNSFYLAGVTVIIYASIDYLDIERRRKLQEKELELSRLRELKAKAELEALHSKVNPHFLYNALNSIADLSVSDGKKARRMTIALADLFRYSINYSNNNYSTVREELAMADVYLQIEKIRFEDQLNYTVASDPKADYYLVPRFLIQPLVENAVKHGLKATGQVTEITVGVWQTEQGIMIDVADTGPSFPEEINPGYGVKSVFDKLELLFPGEFEVSFINNPVKKVSVLIKTMMKNEPGA